MKKYVDIHSFAKDNMKAYHTENGVEFAVPMKAINEAPATDSDILVWHNLPETPPMFVSVLGHMTDAGPFPSVRECYFIGDPTRFFFPALTDGTHPIDRWAELPEGHKEVPDEAARMV